MTRRQRRTPHTTERVWRAIRDAAAPPAWKFAGLHGTQLAWGSFGGMGEFAIHPPVHVITHPDEPIRSLDAAARYVERHVGRHPTPDAERVIVQLRTARTPEQADAAGMTFRAWAKAQGLLLVPPEDSPDSLGISAI